MIVDKINEYLSKKESVLDESLRYEVERLAGWCFKRQFMTDESPASKGKIRLSSCGKCPRQVAYAFHGIEKKGKESDSRAKIIFWTGDLSELTVTALAKLAGCVITGTGLNQITVKLPVNGSVIEGHPDGILIHEKELYLLEIKSMSSFSFARFERGELDSGYVAQMNAYMECLGLKKCVMVALNKDNGIMGERVVEKDEAVVEKIRTNLKAVLHSTPETLPPPPAELNPNADGFFSWVCLYCSYWGHCRPNAEKVLVKNSYKLQEKQTKEEQCKSSVTSVDVTPNQSKSPARKRAKATPSTSA
jgi:hypothetical protein